MNRNTIIESFKHVFGKVPTILSKAPGRINFIGEHTDYNFGFVLPGAINKYIYFAIRLNNSEEINLYSLDLQEKFSININLQKKISWQWAQYLIGVIAETQKIKSFNLKGFDCVFGGNLPIGAGLSSSAALETGFATALNQVFGLSLTKRDIVNVSQMSEHKHVGIKCGIMDQFASVMGKKGHVFKLDCKTLEYSYYQLKMKKYNLLLINSNIKHSNANNQYSTRRLQCLQGVQILKKYKPDISSLRDVSENLLEDHKSEMPPVVYQKCKYVLDENERVHLCCEYLKKDNLEMVGKILYNGQKGLSEQYKVSCQEIDFLIETAKSKSYILGARMMGGGFGGCTINIIQANYIEQVKNDLSKEYFNKFGVLPAFYKFSLEDGACLI